MVKLIVGLGNPGEQYEQTRHNAGFAFLDNVANRCRVEWQKQSRFDGVTAEAELNGQKLIFLKPMTYMNRSGLSVGKLVRYYKFAPEEMLVVHDELELASGLVRLKHGGGHAGHNGLRDIISVLDARDFYRLRIGIGRPGAGIKVADYVLSRCGQSERVMWSTAFEQVNSIMEWLLVPDLAKANAALEQAIQK